MRFVFAIPLKARSACSSWELAQRNLRRTVRSAQAAGGDDGLIVVACHDEPDLAGTVANVHVLPVPFSEPTDRQDAGRDKARKRRSIGAWLRETLDGPVYVMFLDADDLVHRDVVSHALAQGQGSYLVNDAYSFDLRRRLLQHRYQGFPWARGSCFVCRFNLDELPTSADDTTSPYGQFGASPDQRGHLEYPELATDLGRPPVPFPFGAALYTVNHSESTWARRTGAQRPVVPRELVWPKTARRILADDFSAPDLVDEVAGTLATLPPFVWSSAQRVPGKLQRTARSFSGRRGFGLLSRR
jgi:hypothetical protein